MGRKEFSEKQIEQAWNNSDTLDNSIILTKLGYESKYVRDDWNELPGIVRDRITTYVRENDPLALDETKYINMKKKTMDTGKDPELAEYYCNQREGNWIWVHGYRKKDGTYVEGYCKNGFNYS